MQGDRRKTALPELARQVRQRIAEIIELADQDALDLMHSRQDVLDILDSEIERGVAEADREQLIGHDEVISDLRDRFQRHRR
jgi:predicted transcriptional regulator